MCVLSLFSNSLSLFGTKSTLYQTKLSAVVQLVCQGLLQNLYRLFSVRFLPNASVCSTFPSPSRFRLTDIARNTSFAFLNSGIFYNVYSMFLTEMPGEPKSYRPQCRQFVFLTIFLPSVGIKFVQNFGNFAC